MNTTAKKTIQIIALFLDVAQDTIRDNRIRLLEERVAELEHNERFRVARDRLARQRADRATVIVQNPHFSPRFPATGSGFTAKDLR